MTMVSNGPYALAREQKQFERTALAGPNVKSYNVNYDKFQPKAAPIKVPDYKMAEGNKWQNSYGKMQTNSHPDFKPIYGPQENKRPHDEMMDLYKRKKEQEEKEKVDRVRKDKERKEQKQQTPKKQRENPNEDNNSYKEPKESPKKVTPSKEEKSANQRNEKPIREEKSANQRKVQSPKVDQGKRQQRVHYDEPERRKPFNKDAVVGPKVKSYNNDYDRKFQVKSNNMTVPDYKPGGGNRWQKSYGKMQSSSHPDFQPIYGPQKEKRGINMLEVYKQHQQKEKQAVKDKVPAEKIKKIPTEKKVTIMTENKHDEERYPPETSPRRENEKNQTTKSPKRTEKLNEIPRKEHKDSPRHEESRVHRDYTPPRTDDNEEKYYGYQDRPVRKDDHKEPVTKKLYKSTLKQTPRDSHNDNKQEIKSTPRDKRKEENKEKKEVKTEEKKREEKVTPREKKDPYENWKRDEKDQTKPREIKPDPYDYKRFENPEKEEKQKEAKPTPRQEKQRLQKRDAQKQAHNDKKTEEKQQPKRPVPSDRERATKARRDDDSTRRDHARPTKTQNNNTSIVRDGGLPAPERRNKPTAKVLPTTRDTKDDKKWLFEGRNNNGREEKSVRARFYEKAEMDDVLQEKIATQLRQNGIAETKVVPLSAKITQAVRDDVIDANQTVSPQVTATLTDVINKHLDPILFNKPNATDLRDAQKTRDAKHLSNLVLLRMGQMHEEIELCKLSVDDPRNRKGKGQTPRDESQDRSMILAIKDGIEKQKTERDILRDKLMQAQNEAQEAEDAVHKRQGELQNLDADNWQLKQDLNDTEQTMQGLTSKLKEQQKVYDNLDKQHQEARQENTRIKSRLNESEGQNQGMSSELAKLQSENARLKVLTSQKEKEILHLRDPDKDMVHKIRILSDEVTMLRTQSRRLNEEKALLKSRSQKMESSLDESNRQKGKLSVEKDNLHKENQDLKQRYRKLALSNPQTRTLPDITTGKNGPSNQGTPRTHSREPPRSIRYSDDRRMSATQEDEENGDEVYGR